MNPENQTPQTTPESPAPAPTPVTNPMPPVAPVNPQPQAPQGQFNSNDSQGDFIPDSWPGGFGAYKYSKQIIMFNLGPILFSIIAGYFIDLMSGLVFGKSPLRIILYIVAFYFSLVSYNVMLSSSKKEKLSLGQAANKAGKRFLPFIGLEILRGLLIILSFAVFIIPFFFVLPRVMLAPYYFVDENLGPIEALQKSWDESKGNSGKIWGIIGVSILFGVLCLVIIGLYFSVMYQAALVVLYRIMTRGNATVPVNSAAPAVDPASIAPTAPVNPSQYNQ